MDSRRATTQQQVGILVDDAPLSARTVSTVGFGGRGQIVGDFTQARAKALAVEHRLPLFLGLQGPS